MGWQKGAAARELALMRFYCYGSWLFRLGASVCGGTGAIDTLILCWLLVPAKPRCAAPPIQFNSLEIAFARSHTHSLCMAK